MNLEEFVLKANNCNNISDLNEKFVSFLKEYGYDRFVMGRLIKEADECKYGLLINYPEEWFERALLERYLENLTLYNEAIKTTAPFTWEHALKLGLSKDSIEKIDELDQFSLKNTMCIPLKVSNHKLIWLNIATSTAIPAKKNDGALSLITIAYQHFYSCYCKIRGSKINELETPNITPTEKEILLLLKDGKSRSDIAYLRGHKSNSAVNSHIEHIFTKLEANSVVLAVVKAIKIGLIPL